MLGVFWLDREKDKGNILNPLYRTFFFFLWCSRCCPFLLFCTIWLLLLYHLEFYYGGETGVYLLLIGIKIPYRNVIWLYIFLFCNLFSILVHSLYIVWTYNCHLFLHFFSSGLSYTQYLPTSFLLYYTIWQLFFFVLVEIEIPLHTLYIILNSVCVAACYLNNSDKSVTWNRSFSLYLI